MTAQAPKVMLLPFAYPDYPPDLVERFIRESEDFLRGLGLQVQRVPAVAVADDVPAAIAALRSQEYDLIVATLISWVEAPLFTAALRPVWGKPLLLWSHTTFVEGDTRFTIGALPAAGVIRETLEEMGARFTFTWGMPGEERVRRDVVRQARAAAAANALSQAKVGLFGYASMGMYTGTIDHTQLRAQIGPEIEQLDQYLIIERFEHISDANVRDLLPRSREWLLGDKVQDADILRSLRFYAAIKALAREHRLDALTVKCQYELSRVFGLAPCVPLSILGDEMVTSCEGDVPLVVSQLILHCLTGGVTSYGDLHHVDGNKVLWGSCGYAPLSCAAGRPVINKHTALYEGLLNSSPFRAGTVTLARLSPKGRGFKLHIASGEAIAPPSFREVGCPAYPLIQVVQRGDIEHFMQNLGSQHYAIVYGDVTQDLLALSALLGVEAIVS